MNIFYQYLVAVWTANIFPIFREPGLIYSDSIGGWLPNRKFLHCDWRIRTSASVKNEPSILDEGLYPGGKQPQQGTRRGGWATRKQGDNPPSLACYGGPGSVLPCAAYGSAQMPQYDAISRYIHQYFNEYLLIDLSISNINI